MNNNPERVAQQELKPPPPEQIPKLADPRCHDCHGTGIYCVKVNKDGSRTRFVCKCVARGIVGK